jgi:urease accessory protein
MDLVECVVGNINDPKWHAELEQAEVDILKLDQWEAQKNRLRKSTRDGTEIALSLARTSHLRDGDILLWDEISRKAVIVEIQFRSVMVVHLEALLKESHEILIQTTVELGHALGNQHWPAVVKGTRVYVPVTVDEKVMASVMRTHAFPGISFEFVPGHDVIPYLAPDEARRLFGGTDVVPHQHEAHAYHEHENSNEHQHLHVHSH